MHNFPILSKTRKLLCIAALAQNPDPEEHLKYTERNKKFYDFNRIYYRITQKL